MQADLLLETGDGCCAAKTALWLSHAVAAVTGDRIRLRVCKNVACVDNPLGITKEWPGHCQTTEAVARRTWHWPASAAQAGPGPCHEGGDIISAFRACSLHREKEGRRAALISVTGRSLLLLGAVATISCYF